MSTDDPAPDSRTGDGASRPKSRRGELLVAVFSMIVILSTLTWLTVDRWQIVRRDAESNSANSAVFLADHAQRLFESAELVLGETMVLVAGLDWQGIRGDRRLWQSVTGLARRFPYIDAISLHTSSGELALTTHEWPPPADSVSGRGFFRAHLEPESGLHVGLPAEDEVTGKRSFMVSRRLEGSDGRFFGTVSITLNLDYFTSFYGSIHLRHSPVVTLFRRPGREVLVQVRSDELANDAVLPFDARTGTMPGMALHAVDDVGNLPVAVSVAIPAASLRAAWREGVLAHALTAGAALMALGLVVASALRQTREEGRYREELERHVAIRTRDLSQANRQLEVLFREVQHRVRNNLQVITSLLRLQAARVTDPAARASLRQSVERIQAMGLVHRLLYGTEEPSDLDFPTYLRLLADHLASMHGMRDRVEIRTSSEPAHLDLDVAIPLCLIVNEVLSNALRHAFPGGKGAILVEFRPEPAGGGRWLLDVTDDGVGLPPGLDWRREGGLGFQIVRTLAASIGGETGFGNGPEGCRGTRFTLAFPARH
jgi:two-component system, sensor histidine kinase PdtaS